MKVSLNWLNDYIDVSSFLAKPEELGDKLTAAGHELEGIENLAESFKNVVIGHILEKGQHPDADRLSLCQVSTGDVTHQIVCGAQNHQQGDKVIVALPGAVLPGNFAIKKSKIRGVESNGMLCSEVELGLADESPGIMILPEEAELGVPFAEYSGLNDIIIDLGITANRADCLSHYGLAREIGVLLDQELKVENKLQEGSGNTQDKIKLEVKDSELCPRYCGRYIANVKIGPSPKWLSNRLEALGMNSINNVVDITNFVMMDLGQPLHAFDADQLSGSSIVVDRAQAKEKFITLDGTEIELSGDELMIRDAEKPVALAGVVGGVNSGVTEETKNLFIESAFFTMAGVRKTARKFGIETDSSYRFARGVDPENVAMAMDRACALIQELAGGEVYGNHYDHYPQPIQAQEIEVSADFVAQKLGYEVSEAELTSWLRRLNCEVSGSGQLKVTPPLYRGDLSIAEDLVEEYARLNGYDKIPETLPLVAGDPPDHHPEYILDNFVHDGMQAIGYHQAVNHSFTGSEWLEEALGKTSKLNPFNIQASDDPVKVKNPISEELNTMRTALWPGLFKNVLHNFRHGGEQGRLYELGFVFDKADEYKEEKRLSMMAWGSEPGLWSSQSPLIYRLKSDVEAMLGRFKSRSWKWKSLQVSEAPDFLHPGQSASLFYEGKIVGVIGTVHPKLAERYKLRTDVVLAEINIGLMLKGQPRRAKAVAPSKYPMVERDLAFLMPENLPAGDVMAEMKKVAGALLTDIHVFDVYSGEKLPEGQRSVAFRLRFQNAKETLSEEQVSGLHEKLINSISQKFSVSVR